jgi:flagellar biosynthesis GTPase FlhF
VLRPGRRNARRKTDASDDSITKPQADAKDDPSQNQQELLNENRELQEENRRKELELEQARQQLQQLQTQQQQIQGMSQSQASWDVTAFLDQQSASFSDPSMATYQQSFPSPGIPTPPSDTPMYEHFFSSAGIPPTPGTGTLNFSSPNGLVNQDAANVNANGYMNQLNFPILGNEVDNMLDQNVFAQDFADDLAAATSQVHLWSDPSPHQRMDNAVPGFDDFMPYYSHFGHDPLTHRGTV